MIGIVGKFKSTKVSFFTAGFPALLFILFVSCTNPSQTSSLDDITLRKTAATIESELEWTSELESEVLTQDLKHSEGIEKSVKLDGRVVITTDESVYTSEKIYPYVKGFAPLNTNALSPAAREVLNGFCNAIVKGENASSFMETNAAYSLALFLYDIKDPEKEDKPVFADYLLGEPFMGDAVQCPVRFFYSKSKSLLAPSLDVFVYLNFKDDRWRVCQISYMDKERK